MKRSPLPIILLSFLFGACAGLPANAQADEPVFLVTTKNADDQVSIQQEDSLTRVDVASPTGIGWANFELVSGTMPQEIIVRLHLRGLEDLRITSAQESISASVSSSEAVSNQSILSAGNETPILPGHPLWMKIEVISERAEKTIPLEAGYFEIALPKEFLQKVGTSFQIEWIDFYR